MNKNIKKIHIDRINPIVRIPQDLFKNVDKRKKKILVNIETLTDGLNIKIDKCEFEAEGNGKQ